MTNLAIILSLCAIWSATPTVAESKGLKRTRAWSEWSVWSPCTKTCGTGVTSRTRQCHPHRHTHGKSQLCAGPHTLTKVCNEQRCPEGSPEPFSAQCAKFNGQILGGSSYNWIPFHRIGEDCVLNCRAVNHKFYARLKPRLEDGTPCGEGKICLKGRCLLHRVCGNRAGEMLGPILSELVMMMVKY